MKLTHLTTTLAAAAAISQAAPLPNNKNNNAVEARAAGPAPAPTSPTIIPNTATASPISEMESKEKGKAGQAESMGVDIRDTGSDSPSAAELSDHEYEELVARELAKRTRTFICVIL